MTIDKNPIEKPPVGDGDVSGESSMSALQFNSSNIVDYRNLSQSEIYALSLATNVASNIPSPEYVVVNNYDAVQTTAATSPGRIYAFASKRDHRRHNSVKVNEDGDAQLTEDRAILNSLNKLIAEGEAAENAGVDKKRKRKSKVTVADEVDYGVVKVNGEDINLNFLACDADGAYAAELNKMTVGMETEDQFLGFLHSLVGRWGSSRRRRKFVDAAMFLKALPVNWKIQLSLRPRARQPSLYCRRFVSPSNDHFNSCKDVALYLKSQFGTTNVHPPNEEEEAMMQTVSDCQVDLGSVGQVPVLHPPASNVDSSGTNDMHKVPLYNLIECYICRFPFTSIGGLEHHLKTSHRANILDINTDTLTRRKRSVPHGLLLVREPKDQPPIMQNSIMQKATVVNEEAVMLRNEVNNIPMNGEGSSRAPNNNSEGKTNLKARCVWCRVEFFRKPVDAETHETSSRFMCPNCKKDERILEKALNKLTRRANK